MMVLEPGLDVAVRTDPPLDLAHAPLLVGPLLFLLRVRALGCCLGTDHCWGMCRWKWSKTVGGGGVRGHFSMDSGFKASWCPSGSGPSIKKAL